MSEWEREGGRELIKKGSRRGKRVRKNSEEGRQRAREGGTESWKSESKARFTICHTAPPCRAASRGATKIEMDSILATQQSSKVQRDKIL